jgi:hypothetical protein
LGRASSRAAQPPYPAYQASLTRSGRLASQRPPRSLRRRCYRALLDAGANQSSRLGRGAGIKVGWRALARTQVCLARHAGLSSGLGAPYILLLMSTIVLYWATARAHPALKTTANRECASRGRRRARRRTAAPRARARRSHAPDLLRSGPSNHTGETCREGSQHGRTPRARVCPFSCTHSCR